MAGNIQRATECWHVAATPGRPTAVHRGAVARPVAFTGDFRRGEGEAAWTALTERMALWCGMGTEFEGRIRF